MKNDLYSVNELGLHLHENLEVISNLHKTVASLKDDVISARKEASHATREMKAFKKDMQGAKSELTTHAMEQIDEAFFKRYDLINKMNPPIAAKKPLSDTMLYLAIGGVSGWVMVLAMAAVYIKQQF